MNPVQKIGVALACASLVIAGSALAQPDREHGGAHPPEGRAEHAPGGEHRGEAHPGPRGYQRVGPPHGWDARPKTVDRAAYRHNFRAARSYRIGPYHRPAGWAPHHWAYGEVLPRAYWGPDYLIGDYWLFALEVPPAGYEWVRDDADALLVDTNTGEILQVEYGVFA
ncbi:MAG TPA: RcnB family protein [Steroidobacteraceae bacterium]|nr:RcnB family protein [Steroidobacteraceae bacterium]